MNRENSWQFSGIPGQIEKTKRISNLFPRKRTSIPSKFVIKTPLADPSGNDTGFIVGDAIRGKGLSMNLRGRGWESILRINKIHQARRYLLIVFDHRDKYSFIKGNVTLVG